MASRKTVFGIGVPQDPSSPESGPLPLSGGTAGDAEDRSSPTVVDDAKVAEGLKQLRSWYQGDGQDLTPDGIPVARPPRGIAPGSLARPTAVGHATAPPAAVQQQPRPFAPDPMRATMYGHDIHSFDVDPPTEASATSAAPPPPSSSTALVLASAQEEFALSTATPLPEPSRRGPSGSFQLAQQVQAERLQRPAGVRRSSQDMAAVRPPVSRSQLVSRLMFGGGLLALAVAVVMWLKSESGSDGTPGAPFPAPPTNVAPPPAWIPTPPPPEAVKPTTQSARATERALVPAAMRARPGAPAPIAAPSGERALPAPAVTRRRAPKVEVEKADDGDDETPAETAEREPSEKRTEPAAAPEPPVRRREAPAKRDRSRVGVDNDATMPPSED